MIIKFIVDKDKISVKEFMAKKLTNAQITTITQRGFCLVNNQNVKNHYIMNINDCLEVVIPPLANNHNITPIKGNINIVYEDSYLLVLNKQRDLAVIPTKEHFDNSLANYVMRYYFEKGINSGIHFVNRLDYPTTGLIIMAKSPYIVEKLKEKPIIKKYLLKVIGHIDINTHGVIKKGIVKMPDSIIKRMVSDNANMAITEYTVLDANDQESLIEACLITGKTHQLRVHFSNLGYPIKGDLLYGNGDDNCNILYLHSYKLEFIHPMTNEKMKFEIYPDWY